MASLQEIQSQIAAQQKALVELEKQAEQIKREERKGVIAELKAKMAEFGITVEDLGGIALKNKSERKPRADRGLKKPVKFRDPATGKEWTGLGRAPSWIKGAIEKGDTSTYEVRQNSLL